MNKDFLTKEERDLISSAVSEAESTTAGEIRVVVVANSLRFKNVHAHAVESFAKYGLHNTINKTGILIFLSVEEKRIEILADEGINAKVEQNVWDDMVTKLAENIRKNGTCKGICDLVKEVGKLLTTHFPIQPGDKDELSNEVVVEE